MNNPALAAMSGEGGDYAITAGTTPTTGLLFSHIVITADATFTELKIAGTSVLASRHYTGTLPQGYICCAGGGKSFNYVKLATGTAQGIIFDIE